MKTQTTDFSGLLSDEQKKTVALMQHLENDFFILEDSGNGEAVIFEGTEEEAREQFEAQNDEDGENDFFVFCLDNFTEADEYDEDGDHLVLTDEEADEKAAEYIEQSLWAFIPSFLADETGLFVEVFEAIQGNGKCESNNDAILSIIEKTCGLDEFVKSAISADGRGHFISHYDGKENEETVNGETFYIYRTN